jgi:hypothetical protein
MGHLLTDRRRNTTRHPKAITVLRRGTERTAAYRDRALPSAPFLSFKIRKRRAWKRAVLMKVAPQRRESVCVAAFCDQKRGAAPSDGNLFLTISYRLWVGRCACVASPLQGIAPPYRAKKYGNSGILPFDRGKSPAYIPRPRRPPGQPSGRCCISGRMKVRVR